MASISCRILVTHLLTRETKRQLLPGRTDIPPNITPHVRPLGSTASNRAPHAPRRHASALNHDGSRPFPFCFQCSPRSRRLGKLGRAPSARSRAPGGGGGASHACLLVLLCPSRTSTAFIRRHRVCAVVLAQLTGCLEGERTACVAMPAMCDASTLCLRLVGSASHGLRAASPRDPTRCSWQVGARWAAPYAVEGDAGLLAVGGGLASVVAAALS